MNRVWYGSEIEVLKFSGKVAGEVVMEKPAGRKRWGLGSRDWSKRVTQLAYVKTV